MDNCQPLFWFGLFVFLLTTGLIIVPYIRRRADLLTGWNMLLLSVAMFVGLGCIEASTAELKQSNLNWFNPSASEVRWLILTLIVFMAALLGTYYLGLGRSYASRSFSKWPPQTPALYLSVIAFCLCIQAISFLTMGQTFFGPLFMKLTHKALAFASVFAFMLWYRNRLNLVWFFFFCGVFAFTCVSSIQMGIGRRLLLSMFVGPVLCIYWIDARKWRPSRSLIAIGVAGMAVFVVGLMYSSIRHFSNIAGQARSERSTEAIVKQIRGIGNRPWLEMFTRDKLFYISQQNIHYSLLVKRHVDNGRLETKPLNTIYFWLVYPIPRKIWTEKPVQLCITAAIVIAQTKSTNWGTGVSGHAAYEGGPLALALYTIIVVIGLRFFDAPLKSQPDNPFLIAMLAAGSPHIIGWARGDLANMTLEAAEVFLFAVIVNVVFRTLFGTEKSDPRTRANPMQGAGPVRYPYPNQPFRPRPLGR